MMSALTLEQAQTALNAALQAAADTDTKMNIAVVDEAGQLTAFYRMDRAWRGSIDIALTKARTAAIFETNTGDLGQASQPGGPLFNIELSNGGLITFPGGVPIVVDGEVVGAVGVSGSTIENDHTVAQAGADSLARTSNQSYAS
jgi:uncharacterized protein GlcG (DUF336 family)